MRRPSVHIALILALASAAGSSASVAADKPLSYPLAQLLKDVEFNLDRLDGAAQQLKQKSAGMKVGDGSVQIQAVDGLLNTRQQVDGWWKAVDDRLAKLPAAHGQVKEQTDRIPAIKESIEGTYKKLAEVKAGLSGAVAQGSGAQYEADLKRLRELAGQFAYATQMFNQPPLITKIAKTHEAALAERKRFGDTYAGLLKQSTPGARDLAGVLNHFDQTLTDYDRTVMQFVGTATQTIGGRIEQTLKTADTAAAEKKYPFFGVNGGIASEMKFIGQALDLLIAVAPKEPITQQLQTQYDQAIGAIKQKTAALMADIVATNTPPDDAYQGPDRPAMLKLVQQKWATANVKGDVLRVGLNSNLWQRTIWWTYANQTWSRTDSAFIQGHVIVKTDETLATVYYLNLVKDYMAGEQVTAHFYDDPATAPDVTRQLAADKVPQIR